MGVIQFKSCDKHFFKCQNYIKTCHFRFKKIVVSTDLIGRKKLSADRTSAIKNDGLFVVCQSLNDTFKVTLSFDSLSDSVAPSIFNAECKIRDSKKKP